MKFLNIKNNRSTLPFKQNETYQINDDGTLRSKEGFVDLFKILKSEVIGVMTNDILVHAEDILKKSNSVYVVYDGKEAKCIHESWEYYLIKHPDRVKQLGEVFTPTELVLEILGQLPDEVWQEGKTYLDPTCGNGQFLAAVAIIKRELGHRDWLTTIYGVDIMQDNVDECQQRLINIAGDSAANWATVRNNIRCQDGLKYNYRFDSTPDPIDALFDWG